MTIKFTIARRQGLRQKRARQAPAGAGRPPRIACLLALAHRFDDSVRSGVVKDYAELGRLGYVSRARVTQIMNLLSLAPDIQEELLWLPPHLGAEMKETDLRGVVAEVRWDRQRELFCRRFERLRTQIERVSSAGPLRKE
jgi:hypothetical protein